MPKQYNLASFMAKASKSKGVAPIPVERTSPKRSHPTSGSHSGERRLELTRIAYCLIAANGLEGFRTRHVAAAAGIDTGTLHYHYPSKQALIEAVVDHLVADFRVNRAGGAESASAIEALRREIHDVALRLRQSPEQFRVLIDLRVHATRNPAIAKILAKQDRGFHSYLARLLSRGVEEGAFRPDLDLELAASVFRTKLMGLGFMALLSFERTDDIASVLCRQMEMWLLSQSSTFDASPRPRVQE